MVLQRFSKSFSFSTTLRIIFYEREFLRPQISAFVITRTISYLSSFSCTTHPVYSKHPHTYLTSAHSLCAKSFFDQSHVLLEDMSVTGCKNHMLLTTMMAPSITFKENNLHSSTRTHIKINIKIYNGMANAFFKFSLRFAINSLFFIFFTGLFTT